MLLWSTLNPHHQQPKCILGIYYLHNDQLSHITNEQDYKVKKYMKENQKCIYVSLSILSRIYLTQYKTVECIMCLSTHASQIMDNGGRAPLLV